MIVLIHIGSFFVDIFVPHKLHVLQLMQIRPRKAITALNDTVKWKSTHLSTRSHAYQD